jgi:alpha-mannosidase
MNSFIDLSDGRDGLAILNEGLKAYEAQGDIDNTVCLTLIRGYPLRICVTQEMTDYSQTDKGSQSLGKHRFRYAILPHNGDWVEGKVWQASERFNLEFQACQIGPTLHGTEPREKSFLEVLPEGLHVSAVKRSEQGDGYVVRIFNPLEKTLLGRIRLNNGYSGLSKTQSPVERVQSEFTLPVGEGKRWQEVRLVTLEEVPERILTPDDDGWTAFDISKKKILTLEFLPY